MTKIYMCGCAMLLCISLAEKIAPGYFSLQTASALSGLTEKKVGYPFF